MKIQQDIEQILTKHFSPVHLQVENESAQHAGHAGDNGTGESHFAVSMVSNAFEGKNRVTRQRMVYKVLAELMANHIHALSLKLQSENEC